MELRILFLSRWFPYPPDNGSKIRIFNILRQLSREHRVSLLAFAESTDRVDVETIGALKRYCVDVSVFPYRRFRPVSAGATAGLLSPVPRSLVDTHSVAIAEAVSDRVGRRKCDLVIASQLDMAPYAARTNGVPAILEEVELAGYRDAAIRTGGAARRARSTLTWLKLGSYLRRVLPLLAACTVASEQEARVLQSVVPGYDRVRLIPNAVDLSDYEGDFGVPQSHSMVFAGSMTYSANFDAVRYFLTEVYPLIARAIPDALIRITGRATAEDLSSLPQCTGVEFTGHLEDVRPAIARSWLSVVPLRLGGGTRLKILESMALGTPVVSTSKGAEGLDVTGGEHILIADTPVEFAERVVELMVSWELRARLSAAGNELARSRYSWSVVGDELCDLVAWTARSTRPDPGQPRCGEDEEGLRMKILLATHFFPPGHPGGTEAYTLGLAQTLRSMGHSPFVICAERWGEGGSWVPRYEDTVYEGIPVRRLFWNWQLAPDPFVNFYDNRETQRHFGDYLELLRPDVVHVTSCYSLGAGILRASKLAGVPVVVTLTDTWFLCPRPTLQRSDGTTCVGPKDSTTCARCLAAETRLFRAMVAALPSRLAARMLLLATRIPSVARMRAIRGRLGDVPRRSRVLREGLERVDCVLAPSRFLVREFERNEYSAEMIRVSPHGIDVSWLSLLRSRKGGEPPCIGYIGQIEPGKGVDLLIRAFRSISPPLSGELRIYGDLSKNPEFGAMLVRLAADEPNVKFMGGFERSQLAEVLSTIDVVAVPSVWSESFGLVILEAFAALKPVVASNVGGIPELIENEVNGLLFERGDVTSLAKALSRCLQDAPLPSRLRDGIKPVRTINEEVRDLIALYSETIARHRRTATSSIGLRVEGRQS